MNSKNKLVVKFYSEEPLENIMSLLTYRPETLIFIGHKDNMITKKINSLKAFNQQVSKETQLQFIEVSRNNLHDIIDTITNILQDNPNCIFDLTGGSELILIALGCISANTTVRKVRIDPYTGTEIEIFDNEIKTFEHNNEIKIPDNMILHGGALTNKTGSYKEWRFTSEFCEDIRTMWNICRTMRGEWNKSCAIIDEMRKTAIPMEDGFVNLSKNAIGPAIDLLRRLNEAHLLKDFSETPKKVIYRFKNDMIRKVISKAGNILELHIYEVATRNNNIFTDAIIGAHIDWDGIIHDAENSGYDTINEIDVILMKEMIPIFISCKSGKAGGQSLHELATVTRRFGGKYARKALVMSRGSDDSTGTKFFKQRAKDMHIWIIDDIFRMSDEELLKKLKRI